MWWVIGCGIALFVVLLIAGVPAFPKRPADQLGRITPPANRIGKFDGEVVGEANYQDALDRIAGGKTRDGHELEVDARLVLEDDNPHDNKAVQVCIGDETVGYLSRGAARRFRASAPPNTTVFMCRARIVGGWKRGRDTGHYGVELDI